MNLIDIQPLRPGWGRVYQGGELSAIFETVPCPLAVASLIGAYGINPSVSLYMDDHDSAILDDDLLLSMADAVIAFLRQGRNVLIHCLEGKYRSTYLDMAVHMRAGMSFDDALTLIQTQHPIADLRLGTRAQLKRLEPILKEVTPWT